MASSPAHDRRLSDLRDRRRATTGATRVDQVARTLADRLIAEHFSVPLIGDPTGMI
jgi:hypothetical protein